VNWILSAPQGDTEVEVDVVIKHVYSVRNKYEKPSKQIDQARGYHKSIAKRQLHHECVSNPAVNLRSYALLHLCDVQFDMTLHLHVLFTSTLHFVLDLLFEVNHLAGMLARGSPTQQRNPDLPFSPSVRSLLSASQLHRL
jgi:hypothetical protein